MLTIPAATPCRTLTCSGCTIKSHQTRMLLNVVAKTATIVSPAQLEISNHFDTKTATGVLNSAAMIPNQSIETRRRIDVKLFVITRLLSRNRRCNRYDNLYNPKSQYDH